MNNVIALTNDSKIFSDLFYYSTLYGYRFKITGSTEEALAYFVQQRTSLFVVDCSDTEQRFLKFARQLAPGLAVMAICGGGVDEEPAIQAFKNGADSVLRLPCGSREFYYRLRHFLRLLNLNTGQESVQFITLGPLKIYPQNNQVILGDDFVPLTSTEFKLLMLFINKLNQIIASEELYLRMYETDELQYTSRVLGVHISKLRHKLRLNDLPYLQLANIHGKGYSLKYTPETENRNNG